MKFLNFSPRLVGGLMALVAVGSGLANAQTITFSPVTETPTNQAGAVGDYEAIIGGIAGNLFDYPAFNVVVSSGTGGGDLLVGQGFLAMCVNLSYPSLAPGVEYGFSTDGSTLSYDPDDGPGGNGPLGDVWNTNRAEKYEAIRDIVSVFGAEMVALNQNSPEFQQMVTAMHMVFGEISVDGISSDALASLTTGSMQFRDGDGTPLSGAVLAYYEEFLAAVGTVPDNDYTLYAASIAGYGSQDVILIPIPEPSGLALAGLAGVLGLVRRRRCA